MSWKSVTKFCRRIDVRLTLYYVCCVLTISSVNAAFLYYRLDHKLAREAEDELREEAQEIADLCGLGRPDLGVLGSQIERECRATKHYKLSGRAISPAGRVLFESQYFFNSQHPTDTAAFREALRGHSSLERIAVPGRRHLYLVHTSPVPGANGAACVMQLAVYMDATDKALHQFLQNVLMASPALLVLSALLGWLIARHGLMPVARLSDKARQITASDLEERLPVGDTGDALDELANTLNLMLERLDGSFRRLAQFSADVAHELRTPVTTLRTASEVMLKEECSLGEHRTFCEKMLRQCERLTRTINDLLTLQRTQDGIEAGAYGLVDLHDVIEEVGELFHEAADAKGVNLACLADGPSVVMGYESMLRRLLANLVDNALKYTPEGGRVTVEQNVVDGRVRVCVRDTGMGIDEADLPHVFDRFWRAERSRSRDTGGSGLGLSIAKGIAVSHGGTIAIESAPGKGTCFTVEIPAASVP